jgi:predicted kinase
MVHDDAERHQLDSSQFAPSAVADRVLADVQLPGIAWASPVLIGIFGLPGAGKTEVARLLGTRFPLVVLSTDTIRLRYGLTSGPEAIEVMYDTAAILLANGASVVFDGIHLRASDRTKVRNFAKRHGAEPALVYTTATASIIEQRLRERERFPEETREQNKYVISDSHFSRIAAYLEPPGSHEDVWVVDTSAGDAESQLTSLKNWLRSHLRSSRA